MEAILFQNGVEFKRALYPRKDMALVEGLDQSLEWKLIVKNAIPSYDRRTHSLVVTEDNSELPHPTYPHLKQHIITYSTVKRSNAAIITEIEIAEKEANDLILSELGENKHTILAVGALIDAYNGLIPAPNQEAMMDIVNNKVANIWENDAEADAKKDIANANGVPDLDSGWNTNEV